MKKIHKYINLYMSSTNSTNVVYIEYKCLYIYIYIYIYIYKIKIKIIFDIYACV